MRILCHIHSHQPGCSGTWNQGFCFSRCERCGSDLIRSGGGWEPVPQGHRVVWKSGPHRHSLQDGFRRGVPVPSTGPLRPRCGEQAPATRDGNGPEEEDGSYPYALDLAAVVGAGLQLLLRGRSGRPPGA